MAYSTTERVEMNKMFYESNSCARKLLKCFIKQHPDKRVNKTRVRVSSQISRNMICAKQDEDAYDRRLLFCEAVSEMRIDNPSFLSNICFSDESRYIFL